MTYIEIDDQRTSFGMFLLIMGIITVLFAIWSIFDAIENVDLWGDEIYRPLAPVGIFAMSVYFFYCGHLLVSYRKLILTDYGIQYYFNNKLKEKMSFYEIEEVKITNLTRETGDLNFSLYGPNKRKFEEHFPRNNINHQKMNYILQEFQKRQHLYHYKIVVFDVSS